MLKQDLEPLVGQVVILDLVSGLEIVTEVKGFDLLGRVLVSKPWMIFQAELRPKDPRMPFHPEHNPASWHVSHGEYGHPVFKVEDEKPLDPNHIICYHECPPQLNAVYTKLQTGIEIADAGVLKQLDAANKPQGR